MKKYIANTTISVSVTLPNGGNARVSFTPMMNGTSVYYTEDKEIQWALEHHYKFGKMFRLVEVKESASPALKMAGAKKQAFKPAGKKTSKCKTENKSSLGPDQNTTIPQAGEEPSLGTDQNQDPETEGETSLGQNQEEEATPALKEVTVSDMDAAKDYLAENFDVVRTKLKSEESIMAAGLKFGIVFKVL